MSRLLLIAITGCLLSSSLTVSARTADPTFIVDQQVGQATGHTCQSYVLAIALAFKRDPTISLKSWREMRQLESYLRQEVVKARDARLPNVPVADRLASPADSAKAVETVTGNKYTVKYRTYDITQFGNVIGTETGVTTRVGLQPSFIVGSLVKDVVISSAKRIGQSQYNSGHQFAILGVSGPADSTRVYLVLNSAAYKRLGDPAFNTCQDGLPDDPGPYFPSLSWQNDIEFNLDGGKFRGMTVEKK